MLTFVGAENKVKNYINCFHPCSYRWDSIEARGSSRLNSACSGMHQCTAHSKGDESQMYGHFKLWGCGVNPFCNVVRAWRCLPAN